MNNPIAEIENLRQSASNLRRMSIEISEGRTGLTSIMGQIGDVWQGTAADAFLESNEWVVKDMDKLRFRLDDLAAAMDRAADGLGVGG